MNKLIAALAALTAGIEMAASVYSQVQNDQVQMREAQLLGTKTTQKSRVGFVHKNTTC